MCSSDLKVVYFAANLVTWVDEEKRHAELPRIEIEVREEIEDLNHDLERQIDRFYKQNEKEIEKAEAEGHDVRKMRTAIDKEVAAMRERTEADIDLIKRCFDEFKGLHSRLIIDDDNLWRELRFRYEDFFEGATGADAIKQLIDRIDFDEEEKKLRDAIDHVGTGKKPLSAQRRQKAIKRLKIVASFNKRDRKSTRLNSSH